MARKYNLSDHSLYNDYFNELIDNCIEKSVCKNEDKMTLEAISRMLDKNAIADKRSRDNQCCSTYLIIDRDTKLTKIGMSYNPLKRLFSIQSEFPHAILVFAIEGNYEHELHRRYKSFWHGGEWYRLGAEQYVDIAVNYPKRSDTYLDTNTYFSEDAVTKEFSKICRRIVDSNLLKERNKVKGVNQIHWVI